MLKNLYNRIRGTVARRKRKAYIRSRISILNDSKNTRLTQIGNAILACIEERFNRIELTQFRLIESNRRTLCHSDKLIPVLDYGAGDANENRSQQIMDAGVERNIPLRQIARVSKKKALARLLYCLVRELEPNTCLELGTCVGISGAYQASALAANNGSRFVSLEGSPNVARIAEETLAKARVTNAKVIVGPFHQTLGRVLEDLKRIDYFFNDGHHDHDAVLRYFEQSLPYLSDEAVMILDDVDWSAGMKTAWETIQAHDRVMASVDLGSMGLVIIGDPILPRQSFQFDMG